VWPRFMRSRVNRAGGARVGATADIAGVAAKAAPENGASMLSISGMTPRHRGLEYDIDLWCGIPVPMFVLVPLGII